MPDPDFALVEEGTLRVIIFWKDGSSAMRMLDGAWISKSRTTADVIMPDELGDFKAASDTELAELSKQALMGLGRNT